jgi:guanylate kinase
MSEFPSLFGFSISHTTRSPREGEMYGRESHFVSKEVMEAALKNNEFIESAVYSGNTYGTSKKSVEDVQANCKICILDIDVQGVKQIKNTDLNPRLVFVKPPSLSDLSTRLLNRGTETEDSLSKRLAVAQAEMEYGETPGNFDLVIVNDDVETAYSTLRKFLYPDIKALQEYLIKCGAKGGAGDQ